MKVTGHELLAFFAHEWPECYYVDDGDLEVGDGQIFGANNSIQPLDEKYELSRVGFLCSSKGEPPSIETFFRRWKKDRTTATLVIEVPVQELDHWYAVLSAYDTLKVRK